MTEGVELARSADDEPALVSHLFLLASTLARLKINEDACQKFIECRDLAKLLGLSILIFLLLFHTLTCCLGNRIVEEKALFFLGSLTTDSQTSSRYFEECLNLCKSFSDPQREASRFYDILI